MLLLLLPPALGLLQRYFRSTTTTAHFESLEIYSGIARFPCDSPALLFTLVLNNSNNKYSWTCPTENRQCSAATLSATMEKLQLVIAQRSAALHSAAQPSAAYVWTGLASSKLAVVSCLFLHHFIHTSRMHRLSRIFDMTSYFQDGGHDVISRCRLLTLLHMHVQQRQQLMG